MLGAIGAGYCGGGSDNWRKADECCAVIAGKMRALHTPPRVFWQKSLDLLDCKGVNIFGDDQELATICQKRT